MFFTDTDALLAIHNDFVSCSYICVPMPNEVCELLALDVLNILHRNKDEGTQLTASPL